MAIALVRAVCDKDEAAADALVADITIEELIELARQLIGMVVGLLGPNPHKALDAVTLLSIAQ